MNTTPDPTAVAELGEIVRHFLPEGQEVTPETLNAAVVEAQESWERFFVLAIRDTNLMSAGSHGGRSGIGGHLVKYLAGTYDEFNARAAA